MTAQDLPGDFWGPELDRCFGCGSANPRGLKLQGREENGVVVAEWRPGDDHEGWPGIVHGGVLATLLDELTGWAANIAFRHRDGEDERPIVTAEYTVRFMAPARSDAPISCRAEVTEHGERHALVEGSLASGDTQVAGCQARYVRMRSAPEFQRVSS